MSCALSRLSSGSPPSSSSMRNDCKVQARVSMFCLSRCQCGQGEGAQSSQVKGNLIDKATPAGFEPAISGVRGQCPSPLDEGAVCREDYGHRARPGLVTIPKTCSRRQYRLRRWCCHRNCLSICDRVRDGYFVGDGFRRRDDFGGRDQIRHRSCWLSHGFRHCHCLRRPCGCHR